jgi:DNA-binding GntR family transcriptional regulator
MTHAVWPELASGASISRRPLREDAASHIREQIFAGKLRPGSRIDQDALAAELQVSKLPVRESLIQLLSEGLIDGMARRGAFVAQLTREDIEDHYRIFGSLEALAATRAAESMTKDQLAQLNSILKQMRQVDPDRNSEEAESLHFEFHRVINRAGGSRRLNAALRTAAHGIPGKIYQDQRGRNKETVAEHKRIIECLSKRDAAGAAEAVRKHVEAGARAVITTMESSGFWD